MKAAHNVPGYTGLQVENKTYIYIIQKIICYYYKRIYDIWCELLFCQMPAELTCCICDELTMRFGHRVTSWLSSLLCDMVIIHGQSGMYLVNLLSDTKWYHRIMMTDELSVCALLSCDELTVWWDDYVTSWLVAILPVPFTWIMESLFCFCCSELSCFSWLSPSSNQINNTFAKRHMSQANKRHTVAETRQSVHVHYRQCQTARFSKYAWKCWEAQRIDIYTTVSSRLKERFRRQR